MENPGFLKNKYGNLHTSPEVVSASNRTEKLTGEKVSQNPEKQIQNYLDRFSKILIRKNSEEKEQGIEALRKILYRNLIIKDEDINYEYFLKQEQTIAEQQGHGMLEAPSNFKERKCQEIQNDQKNSLDYWIDYLTSPAAPYPDWAKYWVFRSMTEMGGYNKKEGKFSKRNMSSAQAFPTLNAGCLAEVIGSVIRKQKNEDISDLNPKFQELLTTENFSKLYTYSLEQFGDLKWENLENIRGNWKTYKQGTDGKILADSLQGYPLEWCTRNVETADTQLQGGDFHVYYSEDSNGVPKVPRLAIRMDGNRSHEEKKSQNNEETETKEKIQMSDPISGGHTIFENLSDKQKKIFGLDYNEAEDIYNPKRNVQKYLVTTDQFVLDKSQSIGEIRGIEAGQNIDQFIQPVLDEKLKEFGEEGKIYLKKSGDMKRMTEINEKHKIGQLLNKEELSFLYEVDLKIDGFGYKDDPRIKQIISSRNIKEDLEKIFNVKEDDNDLALYLIANNNLINKYIYVLNNLNLDIALKLFEIKKGVLVADNLEKFIGLNHYEIAIKLIESSNGKYVAKNLEKFVGLNHKEIALKLIESGNSEYVAKNLEKFVGLNHTDIALKLIESDKGFYVLTNPKNFKEIDNTKIVSALKEKNFSTYEIQEFERLHDDQVFSETMDESEDKNQGDIILMFIKKGKKDSVINYFSKSNKNKLDPDIALKLIENNQGEFVAENLEKFVGLNLNSDLALKLIELGKGYSVADNLEKFIGLNHYEIAIKLIESGNDYFVVKNLEKFNGLNLNSDIILKLIKSSNGEDVAKKLKKFEGLNYNDIALKLIENNQGEYLAHNLREFIGLNSVVALKLIKLKKGYSVVCNLEKFEGLNYNDIALKLIENNQGEYLAHSLKKFVGLNYNEIALKLIENNKGEYVAIYIKNFAELSSDTALKLIKLGRVSCILDNLERFVGLNYDEIALKLIENNQEEFVVKNLKKFSNLNIEIKKILVEKYPKYADQINEN